MIFALGVLSFVLCFSLTPFIRKLSLRYNLVDSPDSHRKLHGRSIPRIGGVPIVLSYAGALAVVYVFTRHHGGIFIQHGSLFRSVLPGAGLIVITGLLDDLVELKPWQKFVGQFAAAGIAVGNGTTLALGNLHRSHPHILSSAWMNIPLSVLWLVACTNAVNLIDGLDGLAAGVGLFATVTTLLVGVFSANTGLIVATFPLAACLLAFLYYNFNPASIFLGACGSLTIGFLLGCFALIWNQQSGSRFGMAAPMMSLALPLVDVLLAILRRYLRSTPIFSGDRCHIHHMVLARGFKPRQATFILYGVCALAASLALVHTFSRSSMRVAVIFVFFALLWAGVRYLGFVEFRAVRRVLSRKGVLGVVRHDICLHDLERSIESAKDPEACWEVFQQACREMGFTDIQLQLGESCFESSHAAVDRSLGWDIRLPVGSNGYMGLRRAGGKEAPKLLLSTLERLQKALSQREEIASKVVTVHSPSSPDSVYAKSA